MDEYSSKQLKEVLKQLYICRNSISSYIDNSNESTKDKLKVSLSSLNMITSQYLPENERVKYLSLAGSNLLISDSKKGSNENSLLESLVLKDYYAKALALPGVKELNSQME